MATNAAFPKGDRLSVTCSHPTTPSSNDLCRVGNMVGVALTDERSDGTTTVAFDGVWAVPVKGEDASGNAAVAAGDALFYIDANVDDGTGYLSKDDTASRFAGFALETVNSGSTTTIDVKLATAGPYFALDARVTANVD